MTEVEGLGANSVGIECRVMKHIYDSGRSMQLLSVSGERIWRISDQVVACNLMRIEFKVNVNFETIIQI